MLGLLLLVAIALGLLTAFLTALLAWSMTHPPRRTTAWAVARSLPSDPGDLKLEFEEWWLDRQGGIKLPVWEVTGKRSEVRDQRLAMAAVFVHGWGHGRVNALQRIEPFVPLVDRLVFYDLRGHGDATGGPSRLGDGEDDDLLALLERLGEGRFVLIGHSMGAVIALNAALRGPNIAGVIAYGPYCDFHRSLRGRLNVNEIPARPLTDLALLIRRVGGLKPPAVDPERFTSFNVPMLIVHGVNDAVSPLEHSRMIADAAPNVRLIEMQDAAHTDAHWVDREAHDRAVREFFERVHAQPHP